LYGEVKVQSTIQGIYGTNSLVNLNILKNDFRDGV